VLSRSSAQFKPEIETQIKRLKNHKSPEEDGNPQTF